MRGKYAQQYKEIGLKIAYYRKLKGLSQLELAEKIDVIFRISEVLDIEPKAFFEFTSS